MEYAHFALQIAAVFNCESILRVRRASNHKSFVDKGYGINGRDNGLEIGTSYGFSTLWIASALAENGGRLITIDHDIRKSQAARKTLDSAGLAPHVDVRTGKALEVLGSLDGSFDFVLSDADKPNCIRYVQLITGKLNPRAVVLTDNTDSHPDELAGFVKWIRANSEFYSVGVPVGNGMEMSLKRSNS